MRTDPECRVLPSGDRLVAFDLRVPGADGPRQSIPVSWIGPGHRVPVIVANEELLVIGELRRRFYRSGGSLGSRVDVRAVKIVKGGPARQRKALEAAYAVATSSLAAPTG